MRHCDATDGIDVVVIGAGAAGLATAIFAARRLPGWSIVALDGAKKLGAKILVAGGGRCNVTNRVVTAADFWGRSRPFIQRVLAAFPVEPTVAFFREIGVELHEEEDGKLFPNSNRAQTVLAALLDEAGRRGVRLFTGQRVSAVERSEHGFRVVAAGTTLTARHVVLATGGLSLPKTGSDGSGYALAQRLGHTLVPTTPALAPLVLEGGFHTGLSGVSHEVELTVTAVGGESMRLRGSLLWTHFGVSGPVVLNASRHWHRARLVGHAPAISVNFLPNDDFDSAQRTLLALAAARPTLVLHNALATWLPTRVADAVLGAIGVDGHTPLAHLAREDRRKVVRALLAWSLPVRDSRGYGYAEVTAGGVPLHEVNPRSMASRRCPGLYLVGEILDVDGRIGGFNFQWAWSSAWVAAAGLAAAGERSRRHRHVQNRER